MQYPKGGIYLAIPLAIAMAAVLVQPAAAQTAKQLNCNGCVKSKQIKNGGIRGKDIRDGTVEGADVASDSIPADDLSNEPGVEFDNDQDLDISVFTNVTVARVLTVTAPTSGFVSCIASGNVDSDEQGKIVRFFLGWDLVGGTAFPPGENVVEFFDGADDTRIGITALRTFQVAAGTQSFYLKARCEGCRESIDVDFGYQASACMFFPTQY